MSTDQSRIDDLIARLSEGLNVEVKRWISTDEPNGISKMVRGVLALRNFDGGYFVIGFDDKTLQPDTSNRPPNVRSTFHTDKVQGLISRYASERFEVSVVFGQRERHEYPVIVVPEGVKSPVAAKDNFSDDNKNVLIRKGAVYFRTLDANGTPSTAEARPEDWPKIVEICFNNREADIGRFLRRQLAGHDIASLLSALGDLGLGQSTSPAPTLKDRAEALLHYGLQRFDRALAERKLNKDERAVVDAGSWQVGLVIEPGNDKRLPDQVFFRTIASSNPQYTGWPVWLDSSSFRDQTAAPVVRDKAWEALIISLEGWSKHIDFLRFDPKGEFYLWRNLPDDVSERIKPRTALDPIIVILRVAEAILVGLAFAKGLECDSEKTRLGFAFRWTKLKGRELEPWSYPLITISSYGSAQDDEMTTFVELSLDTPASAIAPYVELAVRDLFVLFGGYSLPSAAIENWVSRLVERKLV
jgi:hypothetical protein